MMLAQPHIRGGSPPHHDQQLLKRPLNHLLQLRLAATLSLAIFSLSGCQFPSQEGCGESQRRDPLDACYEPCEGEACGRAIPEAHSLDCIDTDGPLCLAELSWRDELPRRGAITPGERVTVERITLSNAGLDPLELRSLSFNAETGGLSLLDGSLSLLSPRGEPASHDSTGALQAGSCGEGVIPAQGACVFQINAALDVAPEAPVDQAQRALLSLSYELNGSRARAALSAPLLVIDPTQGLSLEAVTLDDSTADGALTPGDLIRFAELTLLNHSLADFEALEVLISSDSPWLELEGEAQMWSEADELVTGVVSDSPIYCRGAERNAEGVERSPSVCHLSVNAPLKLSADAPIGESVSFELRLRSRGERLDELLHFSFEVEALSAELSFEGLKVNSDENGDGELSAGERVSFSSISLLNEGPSALSLQGRLSVLGDGAELLSGSDVSVDLRAAGDDFYERCLAGELCTAELRLRLALSPDLREGDEVTIKLDALDQTGRTHELTWSFAVKVPQVDLRLEELRVTQDSLDERLSGGERGLISYLKIINTGDADALGLTGSLWTESPYLEPAEGAEGAGAMSWSLELHEMSSGVSSVDESELGRCVSIERDEEAYCYQRLQLPFRVSPEAPIGAQVTFWIDLTDAFGQAYQLSYDLELF